MTRILSGSHPSSLAGAYVSKQLGHADSRMVSRHYGHLTDADMAAAIQKNGPSLTLPS
jgi:integrase